MTLDRDSLGKIQRSSEPLEALTCFAPEVAYNLDPFEQTPEAALAEALARVSVRRVEEARDVHIRSLCVQRRPRARVGG